MLVLAGRLAVVAISQWKARNWQNEFKRPNATGILHLLPSFNHGNHVPVESSSQEYLATIAFKTLAPN